MSIGKAVQSYRGTEQKLEVVERLVDEYACSPSTPPRLNEAVEIAKIIVDGRIPAEDDIQQLFGPAGCTRSPGSPQALTRSVDRVDGLGGPVAQYLIEGSDEKVEAVVDVVWELETFCSLEADKAVEVGSEQPHRIDGVVALQSVTVQGRIDNVEKRVASVGILDFIFVGSANRRRVPARVRFSPGAPCTEQREEGLWTRLSGGGSGEDVGRLVLGVNRHQPS
jgi:hypothetical protein